MFRQLKVPMLGMIENMSFFDQMIPWSLGIRLAFYLPWLELLCGCALIFHRLFAGAVAITTLLMVVFIGATAWTGCRGSTLIAAALAARGAT